MADMGPPDRKRRMMDQGGPMGGYMDGPMGGGPSPQDFMMLQRENSQLRMENEGLRREMDGLKATNKFLLEETANMRLAAKAGGEGGAAAGGGSPSGSGAGYHPPVGHGGAAYPPSYSSGGAGPAGAYGQSRMGA